MKNLAQGNDDISLEIGQLVLTNLLLERQVNQLVRELAVYQTAEEIPDGGITDPEGPEPDTA
jgi:hypothetical protein